MLHLCFHGSQNQLLHLNRGCKSAWWLKGSWCRSSCSTPESMRSDPGVVPPPLALAFPLQPLSISFSVHCPLYKARPVFSPLEQMCSPTWYSHRSFSLKASKTFTEHKWETETADRRKLINQKVQNMLLKCAVIPESLISKLLNLQGNYEKPPNARTPHVVYTHTHTNAI